MNNTHLTVSLVEKLQTAISKGKSVSGLIDDLQTATLPGLVEYGCLRFTLPEHLPGLPSTITDSELGKALREIQSDLGINHDGPQRGTIKSLQPRPFEFQVVRTAEDIDGTEWNNYCHRFELGIKRSGFTEQTALDLHFALHEMASNAILHAQLPTAALVGYELREGVALFSVADVGIGVLASLKTSQRFRHITRPIQAIQEALRPGVSRLERGGLGFAQVFKAVACNWGMLRFRSGNACVEMDGTNLDHSYDDVKRSYPPPLPGFQITMCCRVAANPSDAPAS